MNANAVPRYAKKLVSGFGKKNRVRSPRRRIIGMSVFFFILVE